MTMKFDISDEITIRNFWAKTHPKYEMVNEIYKLIPDEGPCKCPTLERFRVLSNAYYRFFNDGERKDFAKIFGFSSTTFDNINDHVRQMDREVWHAAQTVGHRYATKLPLFMEYFQMQTRKYQHKNFKVCATFVEDPKCLSDGRPGDISFRWTTNGNQWTGGSLRPNQAAALIIEISKALVQHMQKQEHDKIKSYFDSVKVGSHT